jgi:hypothetical protein
MISSFSMTTPFYLGKNSAELCIFASEILKGLKQTVIVNGSDK